MVSLTNQARLLAAQEFNRRVLEERARAGENIKTSASRVGVLTGRVARVDPRTRRVVGVTRTKSKTRLQSEKLLRAEIKRQQELARKESDLERFLRNESMLRQGRVTASELRKQIAERKRKGLSKTPAQREALKALERSGSIQRLEARQLRKIGRGRRGKQLTGVDQILSIGQSEEARAGILGSAPFADPAFEFGGRSRAEVIARGGTFGRRVAGESPAQQLSFVRGARIGTATARIGFAKSLLGDTFEQASSESLLGIVGSQRPSRDPTKRARGALSQEQFAPPTFEQVLRQGVGFFTTEAKPITKPKITKAERRQAVQARKAEDFAKASQAREQIGEARARTRASSIGVGDLQRTIGRQLDIANLGRAQAEFGFG
ncbi:MAG: hypothetical protein GTN97_03395, partial [Nitrosopumilaceae archaeon]|nr:hypothetical protein [Nitrosopumilaceae archaeon]